MKYIIISYILNIISLLTERYEFNKLTSHPMYGFIAQLVEHRTGIVKENIKLKCPARPRSPHRTQLKEGIKWTRR